MNDEEILNQIRHIWETQPYSYHNTIEKKKENRYLLEFIREKTSKLDDPDFKYSLSTRIYWLLNGLTDFPECAREGCHNKVGIHKNVNSKVGYQPYCSNRCGTLDEVTKEKSKRTCLERYGVESTNALKEVQEKKQRSIAEHFGDGDLERARKVISRKGQETYLKRTGYSCALTHPDIVARREENNLKKYGCKCALSDESVRKLGAVKRIDNFRKPETVLKHKETFLRNHPTKESVKAVSEKANETKIKNRFQKLWNHDGFIQPLFTQSDLHLNDYTTEYEWHCRKCEHDFKGRLISTYVSGRHEYARCPFCNPLNPSGTSHYEDELREFLLDLDLKVICNDREIIAPLELDLVIPDKRLAIEFDGLYWHSTEYKPDPKYHLKKTQACKEAGYRLIHIFEDEWRDKNSLVKSRLKAALGIFQERFYARNCEIKSITKQQARQFFNENHLQGVSTGGDSLGLFNKHGDLISAMTFQKSRFKRSDEWELVRFANKTDVQVIGGASKLLTAFSRQHPGEVMISYADRRWSDGNVYEKLGFTLDHVSSPAVWYFNPNDQIRFNRMVFQKHNLSKMLPAFDSSLTESQNMEAAGYSKIYDCGNLVFIKTL